MPGYDGQRFDPPHRWPRFRGWKQPNTAGKPARYASGPTRPGSDFQSLIPNP